MRGLLEQSRLEARRIEQALNRVDNASMAMQVSSAGSARRVGHCDTRLRAWPVVAYLPGARG